MNCRQLDVPRHWHHKEDVAAADNARRRVQACQGSWSDVAVHSAPAHPFGGARGAHGWPLAGNRHLVHGASANLYLRRPRQHTACGGVVLDDVLCWALAALGILVLQASLQYCSKAGSCMAQVAELHNLGDSSLCAVDALCNMSRACADALSKVMSAQVKADRQWGAKVGRKYDA